MKKVPLLLIIGIFTSAAHAELFVGEINKPLEFDVTTAGYYKIELEGHLLLDLSYGGEWTATLTTLVDSVPVANPVLHITAESISAVDPNESKSDICRFEVGHHTISGSISIGGVHAERISSTSRSTWQYTVKSAEEIDYRNSIGNLQNSIDQRGTDLVGVKNDIATLQAAVAGQNKGLSDQVANLKKQVAKATQNDASQSAQQTDAVLSAINGVSQQVTTVNNNVTTGNKQNQTLGIIGISLGAVGIGAGIGIPCMMKSMSDENSDVNVLKSPNSDRESINYVSTGSSN